MEENLPQNMAVAPPTGANLSQLTLPASAVKAGLVNAAPPQQTLPPTSVTASIPQSTAPATTGSTGTLPNGQPIDPSVVAVMTAIQHVETGGSSDPYNQSGDNGQSLGAYQWNNLINGVHTPLQPGQIPANFQNAAVQFGLNPNDFSPANQNLVAYNQIAAYKAQGLTPQSIDAKWNGAVPDPNNPGQFTYINPARAPLFASALNSVVQGMSPSANTPTGTDVSAPVASATSTAPPSLGGFLENTVKSGANFLGNLGNAVLHPIDTVQALGGAAVGALQEAGGQTNSNTEDFNNVVNYFKNRYGSLDDLANTVYTDPIGFAADMSAALGVGEGALGAVGAASDLTDAGKLGSLADAAEANGVDFIAKPDGTLIPTDSVSNPVTAITNPASEALGVASKFTNPLTPVLAGAGALIGDSGKIASEIGSQLTGAEPQLLRNIIDNPAAYTKEAIANTTRASLSAQVLEALTEKGDALDESGEAYGSVRASESTIPVAKNFLETQLRKQAGVDVVDGEIQATGESAIRSPKDVAALQQVFNTWKPTFATGEMTPNAFLNFRQDLAASAKYDKEFTASKPVEAVASKIRTAFNSTYRPNVPGLEDMDNTFATQKAEYTALGKGLIDKDGNLTDSAINKIANAVGKGKDTQLDRLEQLVPGITNKIRVLKDIEDIQKLGGTKVGTYPSSFLKAGGVIGGLATGNTRLVATALATTIIASPDVAVPLLRAFGNSKALIANVTAHLVKYATLSTVGVRATGLSNTLEGQASAPTTPDQSGTTAPLQ